MKWDCLGTYMVVWTLQLVPSALRYPLGLESWVVLPLGVFALVFRRDWRAACAAHFAFVVAKCLRQPDQYNSDIWMGWLDFVVVLVGSAAARGRKRKDAAIYGAAPTARICLGLLYLSAGVFKANSSHLSVRTSCSSLFVATLVSSYAPFFSDATKEALASVAAKYAGHVTVVVESSVGLLLLQPKKFPQKMGAFLGLLLHLGIASSPKPNNIVAFSTMAPARYVFVCLESATVVMLEHGRKDGLALFVGLIALTWKRYDAAYAAFAAVIIIIFAALLQTKDDDLLARVTSSRTSKSLDEPEEDVEKKNCLLTCTRSFVIAVTLVYGFLLVPLGLQDQGNTHMFANLRIMGGSNHLFLPTGLLQKKFAHRRGPGPFDGGVVRVDRTSNPRLNGTYPFELSQVLPVKARALARALGHTGREFIPLESRIHGPELFGEYNRTEDAVTYATHAFELRRLLFDAQHTKRETDFYLDYTALPSLPDGTTDWSQALTYHNNTVRFSVDHDGRATCVYLETGANCDPQEPVLQPWPPTGLPRFFTQILLKILVFNPYPLIPGEDHSEMVCCDG